jgi:hypothetical protein
VISAWVFLVVFPLLMGAPVVVRVESETAEQCGRVRKLLIAQLDSHRSNATVSACALAIATVVPPKETP